MSRKKSYHSISSTQKTMSFAISSDDITLIIAIDSKLINDHKSFLQLLIFIFFIFNFREILIKLNMFENKNLYKLKVNY